MNDFLISIDKLLIGIPNNTRYDIYSIVKATFNISMKSIEHYL